MASKLPKFAGAALTRELRKLAVEFIDTEPDGTPITREQKLAKMIWDLALGHTEKVRDENGTMQERYFPPVAWAQQFLFERVEGKAAQAAPEEGDRIKAVDKVRELSRQRLNKLAEVLQ